MILKIHPFVLPLANPFRIAHESRTDQPTLIVELFDEDSGLSGLGEAAMTRYYGLESNKCTKVLLELAPIIKNCTLQEVPDIVMEKVDSAAPLLNPFLRCALDVAVQDLWGKREGKRTGELWSVDTIRQTPTCYTIGMGSEEEMVNKLKAFPWPVYKIKLGGKNDIQRVKALREHTEAPFYVDANTGWTLSEAIENSFALKELGVVFIEQPLAANDWKGHRALREKSALPILADESCQVESDVAKCAESFDGINIKIVKCGGLTPARRMIQQARKENLKVMAGCMTESSVGISAIAQLLPQLDYADMDGAMLLADDPAEGVTFDPVTGFATYPDKAGTGAQLKNT